MNQSDGHFLFLRLRRTLVSCLLSMVYLLSGEGFAQTTLLDTVYTPPGYGDSLVATIFIPPPSMARGVGIILTHGITAPRQSLNFWCDTLSAHGYVAMSIDYHDIDQLSGRYPKPVRAFKTAVQFLRRNAARFGIDADKLVALGQSQGSIVWGQTLIWPNDYAYFNTDPAINDDPAAAILFYGLYDPFGPMPGWSTSLLTTYFSDNPSLVGTKGSCIANVGNLSHPTLLLHSIQDPVIYVGQSRAFRDSLTAHGVDVKLLEFDASAYPAGVRQHVFDYTDAGQISELGLRAKDSILAFLDRIFPTMSVVEDGASSPATFQLGQNYPNPFNPSTTIRYQVGVDSHVRLSIFDLLGREVAVLVNLREAPGAYSVTWNAWGFPSGIYFYKLTAGDFTVTKRLALIR